MKEKKVKSLSNNSILTGLSNLGIPATTIVIELDNKEQMDMVREYITTNQNKTPLKRIGKGKSSLHASETILLLLKIYPLYKASYHEVDELLQFATCYVGSGVLNGLPAITQVDEKMEIIDEIFAYIAEVKEDYFNEDYFRHKGYTYSRNFKDFFDDKDNRNISLYSLFNNNVYKDSYAYSFFRETSHAIEQMLDNYEEQGDSLLYKLENDKMNLSDLIDDPFLNIKTWQVYGKSHIKKDDGVLKMYKDSKRYLRLTCDTPILDFALKLSYMLNLKTETTIVNEDGYIKTYRINKGELIKNMTGKYNSMKFLNQNIQSMEYSSDYRNLPDFMELLRINCGKLRKGDHISVLYSKEYQGFRQDSDIIVKQKVHDLSGNYKFNMCLRGYMYEFDDAYLPELEYSLYKSIENIMNRGRTRMNEEDLVKGGYCTEGYMYCNPGEISKLSDMSDYDREHIQRETIKGSKEFIKTFYKDNKKNLFKNKKKTKKLFNK